MRAIIDINPQMGPGYGRITVYDIGDPGAPKIILKRMADGMTLARGGWSGGEHAFDPARWDYADGCLRIFLSPDVIDNLEPGSHYELAIVGTGICPLEWGKIIQSDIVDDNGADVYSSPRENTESAPLASPQMADIYEGVEKTPEVAPFADSGGMPSGVAAAPDIPPAREPKKGRGCLVLCICLFVFWIGGGWLLWQGAMNTPISNEKEQTSFEIIPRSTERSYVEPDEPAGELPAQNQNK